MVSQITSRQLTAYQLMQRRRFITILATSVAGLNLSRMASAAHASLQPVRWSGYTLGAEGRFTLYTENASAAQKILKHCFAEIRRLESIFSLYQHNSELSKLNRDGYLSTPSAEWYTLLNAADQAHLATSGLFDPTVQPLWKTYASHFDKSPGIEPAQELINAARAKTGWEHVQYDARSIQFKRPEMQLTLNGIAQGFITDHITDILHSSGYTNVLVELGETRAIGPHPEQRPWNLGIKDADSPDTIKEVVELDNQALATSGSYGSNFSKNGRYHHLLHPKTGLPSTRWKSLSVIAPTATEADALSTGLSFASNEALELLLSEQRHLKILKQS